MSAWHIVARALCAKLAQAKETDGDVPARWHYYHVSDEPGHQAALAFRIGQRRLEAFGAADEQFVGSLRFKE
ncbi:MAG: hypothetical protein ABSF26_07005 [Thermoguttaceae bacterium]